MRPAVATHQRGRRGLGYTLGYVMGIPSPSGPSLPISPIRTIHMDMIPQRGTRRSLPVMLEFAACPRSRVLHLSAPAEKTKTRVGFPPLNGGQRKLEWVEWPRRSPEQSPTPPVPEGCRGPGGFSRTGPDWFHGEGVEIRCGAGSTGRRRRPLPAVARMGYALDAGGAHPFSLGWNARRPARNPRARPRREIPWRDRSSGSRT